jgi:FkbM family methyltransferase
MPYYVQIGAGAGDCDAAANFRDGFSSYVKGLAMETKDQIVVVEANKFNIESLKFSWEKFSNVTVYHLAIGSQDYKAEDTLELFYSLDDGPHFQISSTLKQHVRNFFKESSIKSFMVPCMDINTFLNMACQGNQIELLATDIEGADVAVLTKLDLSLFDIHRISFEKSHGTKDLRILEKKLKSSGYRKAGMGMDPHNTDVLWVKPQSLFEFLQITLNDLKHTIWELQIPTRHFLKTKLKTFRSDKN